MTNSSGNPNHNAPSLAARSGSAAERSPATPAYSSGFTVGPERDNSILDAIWIRDARGRLQAIRDTIEEKGYSGDHVRAIDDAAVMLIRAATVVDDAKDTVATKLNAAAQWIAAEKAEKAKSAVPVFGHDHQHTQDAAVRDVENTWRKRMIDSAAEELRDRAAKVEKDAVEAMKNAQRSVGEAWDKAMGPAIFALVEEESADLQRFAIKLEILREELRGKRMAALIELYKGFVLRGEIEKEILMGIAATTRIDELRDMTPKVMEKKVFGGRAVRADEIDKELFAASDLERLIEQRKQARVPEDVIFARKALPALQNAFEVLLGFDQLYLSSAEFQRRFLAADAPARDPLALAAGWATRNLLLPAPNERKIVGPRTRGR